MTYGLGYGTRPLVERAKRDSPRWKARPADQRRVLALLPGALCGFVVGLVLLLLFDH
jgi:hypothetical protein